LAPPRLASRLHSLPPILHRTCPRPISAYSKGSRGLSVTLRVRGIFTTATISPGHWLRQCISRYAIHAGRNLPDKELRSVVVTSVFRDKTIGRRKGQSFLLTSACRHAARTISSPQKRDVRRIVSEDSKNRGTFCRLMRQTIAAISCKPFKSRCFDCSI